MRLPTYVLLLAAICVSHTGLTDTYNTTEGAFTTDELLDEDDYARRLAEVASGKGFINRVFNQVATGISELLSPLNPQPVDRQGIAAVLGLLGPVITIAVTTAIVAAVATAVANFITDTIASGRGMEPDDWELNQSVWMDQLHKDLEYSWQQ